MNVIRDKVQSGERLSFDDGVYLASAGALRAGGYREGGHRGDRPPVQLREPDHLGARDVAGRAERL